MGASETRQASDLCGDFRQSNRRFRLSQSVGDTRLRAFSVLGEL
jgi:hypothetical protein